MDIASFFTDASSSTDPFFTTEIFKVRASGMTVKAMLSPGCACPLTISSAGDAVIAANGLNVNRTELESTDVPDKKSPVKKTTVAPEAGGVDAVDDEKA